jgi:hypothetical protein
MNNWSQTSPMITALRSLCTAPDTMADLDGMTIAEFLRGERFAQPTPGSPPVPESTTDPQTGPTATAVSQSSWLADALWRGTPAAIPWPAPPPSPPATISDNPFERAAILRRRRMPRRPTMGPPFFDELPRDYASHLGPVPRGPDWEQVVTGPTPWSPLAAPPRARDWGRVLTGYRVPSHGGWPQYQLHHAGRATVCRAGQEFSCLYRSGRAELSLLQHFGWSGTRRRTIDHARRY